MSSVTQNIEKVNAPSATPDISSDVIAANLRALIPDGQLTLTTIHPVGHMGPCKTFSMPAGSKEAGDWAANENTAGFNVYWGVNQSDEINAKSKEADITHARFCWADIDPQVKQYGSYEEARCIMMSSALPIITASASVVINSGNGLQALFRLAEPVALQSGEKLAFYKEVNAAVGSQVQGPGHLQCRPHPQGARYTQLPGPSEAEQGLSA